MALNSDRWDAVDRLYHAALARPVNERAAFLADACAGDQEVRREVESLLAQGASAEAALTAGAVVAAAGLLTDVGRSVLTGRRLGAYQILAPLGAGGMGEVYRARDTRLGRDVAIKILPRAFTADAGRLARFEREARVLASLNHPHIAAIYGIEEGSADGGGPAEASLYVAGTPVRALILELVEGDTLAERIARVGSKGLPVKEALDIARQIADALDAAHEKGIVHRDLKPANIKITPQGVVKVLDFGLAKLEAGGASHAGREFTEAPTLTVNDTREGLIVGTAAYMSPEQARGQTVDKRTDIWAFGCVLYEMLTGRAPFARATVTDTLAAIVEREPDWAALPPGTPVGVRRLLARCIEKDPRHRLRDIGDFRLIVEHAPVDPERSPAAGVHRANARRYMLLATLVSLGTFGVGWLARQQTLVPVVTPASLVDAKMTPLTTDPGYEGDPTFAPDGETVAYVSNRTGNFEVFLKQASGGRDINLTNDPGDDVQPAFSPDGRQIAFVSSRAGGSPVQFVGTDFPLLGGGIWIMPALGGSARRVVDRGNFPSWSPDGQYLLFTAGPWFGKKIYRVSAGGGSPQEIPVDLPPTQHWMYASYSPDGRWIVFEAAVADIYVVAGTGGKPHRVARGHHPLWTADGSAVVYSSEEPGRNYSLWQVRLSNTDATVTAAPQPLTVGRGRDDPGAVSRDGKRLAFTAQNQSFNLETMAFDAEAGPELSKPVSLTSGNQLIFFLSFARDARSIVFDSRRGAQSNIWRVDPPEPQRSLTSDSGFDDRYPRWSPDGRTIAFVRRSTRNLQASQELWRMAADGGNAEHLVDGVASAITAWLPDSMSLVYHKDGQLQRFDLATHTSTRLTNEPRVMPIMVVSPDGKSIVYQSTAAGNVDLRLISTDGGPSRVVVATAGEDYHPFFSPSGRWLYFQPDHKNLVRVPGPAQNWRQAPPERVTQFPESGLLIEDAQTSPDGHTLAFSHGSITGDVWILDLGEVDQR